MKVLKELNIIKLNRDHKNRVICRWILTLIFLKISSWIVWKGHCRSVFFGEPCDLLIIVLVSVERIYQD